LERFIKRNAKHPRYVEALFLKGQAYFGDKQWVNAIFAYRAIIEHHSGSSFVAEATFRIGQSFEAMGKCEEAKIFYDTVIQDHAGSKFKKKAAKAKQKLATGQCPAPL
jgi:TolA-binding protein